MVKKKKLSKYQFLKKIYYDPANPGSFGGVMRLYRAAKKKRKKITKKEVIEFLESQDTYTLHKPARFNFPRLKTLAKYVNYLWQIDLIDMGPAIAKKNKGFRYILVAIDILSRFARAIPCKRKFSYIVAEAFKKLIKNAQPKKIQADEGGEFSGNFRKLLREKNIILYSTFSDTKASIVERFNQTLQRDLFRYFTSKNSYYYLGVLQKFISSYNARVHSSHGKRPKDVNDKNYKKVWETLYTDKDRKIKKPKFKVGDYCRLSKYKKMFRKGYKIQWTDEIFVIHQVLDAHFPVVYKVKDLDNEILSGIFYEQELNRVQKIGKDDR